MTIIALLIIVFSAAPCLSAENKSSELFSKIFEDASKCAARKTNVDEVYLCFIKSAPKKCEGEMTNYLASRSNDDLRDIARSKLFMCVVTCADASIYSRTFGECSRK